jgi:hypothetical protein
LERRILESMTPKKGLDAMWGLVNLEEKEFWTLLSSILHPIYSRVVANFPEAQTVSNERRVQILKCRIEEALAAIQPAEEYYRKLVEIRVANTATLPASMEWGLAMTVDDPAAASAPSQQLVLPGTSWPPLPHQVTPPTYNHHFAQPDTVPPLWDSAIAAMLQEIGVLPPGPDEFLSLLENDANVTSDAMEFHL